MGTVVVIGKDWKARALLRAQLLEEKIEVEAYESVSDAMAAVKGRFRWPRLVVADLASSENPADEVEQLAAWGIPVWVIASRMSERDEILQGRGFEAVLWKPVDMKKLVDRIKQRAE